MAALERLGIDVLATARLVAPDTAVVYRQSYAGKELPAGVAVVKERVNGDEFGGSLAEVVRLNGGFVASLKNHEIDLNIADGQINCSIVVPGTVRFGHLHREQDEMWMVADGTLVVPLVDIREGSKTIDLKTKLVLSKGMGVYIPHGVVHGLANYTNEKAVLIYLPTMHFDSGPNTQEWRVVPKDDSYWDFAKPDTV